MRKVSSLVIIFVFLFSQSYFAPGLNAGQAMPFPGIEPTISMDFKDANLKDILKVLSIQSSLNFIASEGVQDRQVTLYLDNVPLRSAMDKLFIANNLSYVLDKEAKIFVVKDWGTKKVETITKVFYLKYATVSSSSLKEEAATISGASSSSSSSEESSGSSEGSGGKWKAEEEAGITEVIKKLISANGSVIEDFRTNSLIVTDTPGRMAVIEQTIAALDISVPQVLIEVEMLDVNKNAVDSLGVNWPTSIAKFTVPGTKGTWFPFGERFGMSGDGYGLDPEADVYGGGFDYPATPLNKFPPNILTVIGSTLTLDYLRTLSDTKYLARPKILTLNNETAEIKITTQEAIGIKSSTSGSSSSTETKTDEAERVDTGVSLRVTPQINTDTGEITMYIVPTVSAINNSSSFINASGNTITFSNPEVRSTKSTVRLKDGETIVIGGLINKDTSNVETKLPILGDIPLLGALFRHKEKSRDKERELLVFITPHIIKDSNMKLAQTVKSMPRNREQGSPFSLGRESEISSALNSFDKR